MQDDKIINNIINDYIKTLSCLKSFRDFPLHLQ